MANRMDLPTLTATLHHDGYRAAWDELLQLLPRCVACHARASTQMRMGCDGRVDYRCTSAPCIAVTGTGSGWVQTPWIDHVTAGAMRNVPGCRPRRIDQHDEVAEGAAKG